MEGLNTVLAVQLIKINLQEVATSGNGKKLFGGLLHQRIDAKIEYRTAANHAKPHRQPPITNNNDKLISVVCQKRKMAR